MMDRRLTARDRWGLTVTEALTGFRLDCVGNRLRISYEQQLIRSAIAEVLVIRLEAAYAPIFRTLKIIESRVAGLATLRADPYAPKEKRPAVLRPNGRPPIFLGG
jgi:hypothetical protein